MITYITASLKRFNHTQSCKPQHQTYPHIKPICGATAQYTTDTDTSSHITPEDKKFIQEVMVTFLYYARAVNPTMITALSTIATQKSSPTEKQCKRWHNFLITHPRIPMPLSPTTPATWSLQATSTPLTSPNRKPAVERGGHFFLSDNTEYPSNNGSVLTVAKIIKPVMSSAEEAKLGALFLKCLEAIPTRQAL